MSRPDVSDADKEVLVEVGADLEEALTAEPLPVDGGTVLDPRANFFKSAVDALQSVAEDAEAVVDDATELGGESGLPI